jgi:hypothetical protein
MLAALAGVIHDCQRADDHEHNRDDGNYQWGLHGGLAAPDHSRAEFSWFKHEPAVNALGAPATRFAGKDSQIDVDVICYRMLESWVATCAKAPAASRYNPSWRVSNLAARSGQSAMVLNPCGWRTSHRELVRSQRKKYCVAAARNLVATFLSRM